MLPQSFVNVIGRTNVHKLVPDALDDVHVPHTTKLITKHPCLQSLLTGLPVNFILPAMGYQPVTCTGFDTLFPKLGSLLPEAIALASAVGSAGKRRGGDSNPRYSLTRTTV